MENNNNNILQAKPGTSKLLQSYFEYISNTPNEQYNSVTRDLKNEIIRRFRRAIAMLYRKDRILLEHKMHEQTICARLAIYLQTKFKDFKSYVVDVEYYMHTKKKRNVKVETKAEYALISLFILEEKMVVEQIYS